MPETTSAASDLQQSLGLQRVVSLDGGRAVLEYLAGPHMCHSGGVVQGGYVCGWIDAAMAHATIAEAPDMTPMSLELKVSFFAPARPGLLIAEGWIERRGRSTCFLEGVLRTPSGDLLAKGTSTARLIPRAQVEASARRAVE
jgi:acyl-coenzyme A thioesterase PaaI-like protein